MYCNKCGTELVWRKLHDLGFNMETGNRSVLEIYTCQVAEALPWLTRFLTGHRKHALFPSWYEYLVETRVIDVVEKETI